VRFLVDANLPRSTAAILRMLGHEVEFARDIGLAAAPDREIAARARGNAAALLTRDLDFANIREYPPEDYDGIIVLRLPDDLRRARSAWPLNDLFGTRPFSRPSRGASRSSRLAVCDFDRHSCDGKALRHRRQINRSGAWHHGGKHLPLGTSMVCRRVTANPAPGNTCQELTGASFSRCLMNGVRRCPIPPESAAYGHQYNFRSPPLRSQSKAVSGADPTPHPAKDGVCTDPIRCGTNGGTDRELALKGAEFLGIGRTPSPPVHRKPLDFLEELGL